MPEDKKKVQEVQEVQEEKQEIVDIPEYSFVELFNSIAKSVSSLGQYAWVETNDDETNNKSINVVRQLVENGVPTTKQLFTIQISEPSTLVFKK